ncbi:MAG: AraC family transcriptional regulator [Christensenellaceae bacterium]|nr:AraC family transcriptional regulator [Christensenellaceae bacterium]
MSKSSEALTNIQNRINRDHIYYNAYITRDASHEPLVVYQSGGKKRNFPGHLSGPAIYDHYIIHYITSGRGKYFVEDKSIPLDKGDAFLIRPYEKVRYQADDTDPYLYYWVGFNGTEVKKLLTKSGFSQHHFTIRYDRDDALQTIMKQISETHLSSPSQEYYLLGLLYQMFSLIIDNNKSQDIHIDQSYLYTAMCYIRTHLTDPELSVQNIANHIGIHRSHLYKVFRNTMNQSVLEVIQKMRLDKAKQLLSYTSHSITDISSVCGFSDASHFSALFRSKEGITPRIYRQKNKQEA